MNEEQRQFSEDEHWLAFRYVAGELSVTEAEAFELQMLDDPRLCDAVVEAGMLTTTIASTEKQSPTVSVAAVRQEQRSSPRPQTAIASIVAVCCCLVVVVLTARLATTPDVGGESVASSGSADAGDVEVLVDVWADGISDDAEIESLETDVLSQDLEVPGWLMAAVSLDAGESSGSERLPADSLLDDMELF